MVFSRRSMKALVIGGASGFGEDVCLQLETAGYECITVGRSNSKTKNHFICDVGELGLWESTLSTIQAEHPIIDMLLPIVGYARPKPISQQTDVDLKEHLIRNLSYVSLAYEVLKNNLDLAENPILPTIGSKWSYRDNCDELAAYIKAKHQLRRLTQELSETHPSWRINHYCLPTMQTPGHQATWDHAIREGLEESFTGFDKRLANKQLIARSLVRLILEENMSGQTFQIHPDGNYVILR